VLCAILLHCCYWPSVELLSLSRLKIWVEVVGAVVWDCKFFLNYWIANAVVWDCKFFLNYWIANVQIYAVSITIRIVVSHKHFLVLWNVIKWSLAHSSALVFNYTLPFLVVRFFWVLKVCNFIDSGCYTISAAGFYPVDFDLGVWFSTFHGSDHSNSQWW